MEEDEGETFVGSGCREEGNDEYVEGDESETYELSWIREYRK